MIKHKPLNHQSLGLSSCSKRSHLLAQRAIQEVTPEAPVLAANRVLENDSGRAGKLVSAHQYSRADHAQQAVLEQVSAGTTEPATEMQSKTSLHLTHGYSRPRHSPIGLKGFMSHYGSSALITRYTFQTISHLGEDDRSGRTNEYANGERDGVGHHSVQMRSNPLLPTRRLESRPAGHHPLKRSDLHRLGFPRPPPRMQSRIHRSQATHSQQSKLSLTQSTPSRKLMDLALQSTTAARIRGGRSAILFGAIDTETQDPAEAQVFGSGNPGSVDRQDVRLATTLYTGERLAGDFDALPHATFSLCVLTTVSTKVRGQAARGGFGRGAAP
ncbi:hypothetical protein Forpi1262_v016647 [Fusarium oxysporum f. sp. raphani]|uniref:Uncharacterized protein n=1 Tax=Fusarium oxysporum f. sp. raphani TaxID=96318 RepID=A0A8J5TUP3_FUSOX|nr:hypothetical protein Forpi1262_v016647 [Fusarium oxysporum f. sp. raphani]